MEPQVVFATYRPHDGKAKDLEALIAKHVPSLRDLELITDREPIVVRAKDGTYIEIFEWRSQGAATKAHEHPAIAAIWEAMGKISEFAPLKSLKESEKSFPHFQPVKLN